MMLPPEKETPESTKPEMVKETEEERLRRNVYLPDMEKFRQFTNMLRMNRLLKRAKITHKQV